MCVTSSYLPQSFLGAVRNGLLRPMAVQEDLEHGADTLRSVMAPELCREVSRRGGGDEVARGLGAGVLLCRRVVHLRLLQLLMDVDATQVKV